MESVTLLLKRKMHAVVSHGRVIYFQTGGKTTNRQHLYYSVKVFRGFARQLNASTDVDAFTWLRTKYFNPAQHNKRRLIVIYLSQGPALFEKGHKHYKAPKMASNTADVGPYIAKTLHKLAMPHSAIETALCS